jgi:hypothetical protein
VLVEGFDTPPTVAMSHNPPFYGALLEGAGLEKAKDLFAYWIDSPIPPERLVRGVERMTRREGVTLRSMNMRRLPERWRSSRRSTTPPGRGTGGSCP